MESTKDHIVSLTYDTALEPKLWPQLLNEILQKIDSTSNNLTGTNSLDLSLAPHFEKANSIASTLHKDKSESTERQSLADLLPMPALVIDKSLNVQSTNLAFRESKKYFKLLDVENDLLTSKSNSLLYKLKGQILLLEQDPSIDYLTLNTSFGELNKPFSLMLRRSKGTINNKTYLLLIASSNESSLVSKSVLSELYDLTKAEQNLACKIVNGDALSDIASEQNRSIHTLRTQLKTIFSKVGVNRQSELVKKLLTNSLVRFQVKDPSNCSHNKSKTHSQSTIELSDGRTLAYNQYGDLNGEPVIVFHPTTGSKLQCHPNDELTRSHGVRLIIIDRPGFGLSSRHEDRSFLSFSDDVEALADSLQLHQFSLLGYCGGGPYSLACAYKLGHRIKHLTVVSGVTPYKDIDLLYGASTVNRLLVKVATVLPKSIFNLASIISMKIINEPESYLDELQGSLCKTDQAALNEPEFLDNFTAALADSLKQGPKELAREQILFSNDWGFDISKIMSSVDLWYGEQDKHVPLELALRLSKEIDSSELHQLQNYGHFMIYHKWSEILEQHMLKINNAGLFNVKKRLTVTQ